MTKPPRFVPTLTEIVQRSVDPETPVATGNALDAEAFQQQLVQRILQRVDVTLERRLREAVGGLILAQTQTLAPLLRKQIEDTVQEAVSLALTQEVHQTGKPR